MTRKLDKTDYEELKEIQQNYADISNKLAANAVDEHYLNRQLQQIQQQKTDILAQFDRMQQREKTAMDSMRDKYGEGAIDIEQGTFTPTESQNETV
jgi:peptidoglycan hydrolase CwlO-like protein